ncbi:MAG: acetate/propionate family kinase [Proteobacteria bacterium]|nr:acetate/propionate family kinase [Pseudomonadota bacterium]
MSRAAASEASPVLVLNAGSSSVKFSVFDAAAGGGLAGRLHGEVDSVGRAARLRVVDAGGTRLADAPVAAPGYAAAVEAIHGWLEAHGAGARSWGAIGHRIVHGGMRYADPIALGPAVLADLEALVPLAPVHQPQQLAAIHAVGRIAPGLTQVACFDTAFHRDEPAVARAYALPQELSAKGYRAYGFHGLSYESIVAAMPAIAPACARGRVVVAHLGNGASMCAIDAGRSVATTMGFTALDGLPMGSRCGALDPGLVLHLLRHEASDADALEMLLYERSGLLGVSGVSSDMRVLLASDAGSAREAIDLFVYRIGRALGSLAAALGGLDALVFTGGIGENAAPIRARVLRDARWLGLSVDDDANARGGAKISREGNPVSAWVIPSDENTVIARHTQSVLAQVGGAEA